MPEEFYTLQALSVQRHDGQIDHCRANDNPKCVYLQEIIRSMLANVMAAVTVPVTASCANGSRRGYRKPSPCEYHILLERTKARVVNVAPEQAEQQNYQEG